jgi:hypothetical protein
MMNRSILLALSAGLTAVLLAGQAHAGNYLQVPFFEPTTIYDYDGDPAFAPVRRFYRYLGLSQDEMTPEQFDRTHASDFDESYYVPQYTPPKPARLNQQEASLAPPPPVDHRQATATTKLASTRAGTATTATGKTSLALTCTQATTVVEGYGFTAVKPASCKGKVYAFNATRDGNSFAIRLDATSGELTEVKKLK